MALPKKSSKLPAAPLWVLIMLMVAVVVAVVITLSGSSETNPDPRLNDPKEWSKKLIEVKKDPRPDQWKRPIFKAFYDKNQRQKAAIDVLFNQMLSQIETALNIPSTVPPAEVSVDSKKYLIDLYGDAQNVPSDAYRTACLRIYNSMGDFKEFYKGDPRKVGDVVYRTIKDFYDQGKPPSTLSISAIEEKLRHLDKNKRY